MSILQPVPGYAHRSPGSPFSVGHWGVDIPAPAGTPVVAVADGVVRSVGDDTINPFASDFSGGGGGLMIVLDHRADAPGTGAQIFAGEAQSQYVHLSRIGVTRGQLVRAGQAIGNVGSTGNSTGPHLHFGLRIRGAWRDYRDFVAGGRYQAVALSASQASPSQAGPLQAAYTGEELIPLRPGQSCPPGYQRAAVDPRLAGVPGLNLLTGWAGTKPFDQLAPGEANACVRAGAFQEGDEANQVGVAEAYGLLGEGLDALGDIARNGLILLGLVGLLIVGVVVLSRGR